MNTRNKLSATLAGLLAAVLLLGLCAPKVSAEKSSAAIKNELNDLEAEKAKIDKELKALESQLSSNMDEMEAIVAQKNVIDQEVFLLYEQIENINNQVTAYNNLIADKQDELDAAELRLAELQKQNKERIRAMEKNGTLSYWSVIFKANNFSDLLDRLRMVQEIADADRRRVDEMTAVMKQVADAKASLETEKAALETTQAELAASQVKLEEKRAAADALLAKLVAKGQEYQALVDAAAHDRDELKAQIVEKEEQYDEAKDREYQQYLAQLQQQQQQKPSYSGGNAGTSNTVSGVSWLVPLTYTAYTSAFGWRTHPIYGDQRFHKGVDLAAPTGTPIYATRSGVVTTTSYDSSSGYHVIIDHQDGFESRYLHLTHYSVSPGQFVYAGQQIGACGSTGASTGPHLHFGIYFNGTPVNPALYIKI